MPSFVILRASRHPLGGHCDAHSADRRQRIDWPCPADLPRLRRPHGGPPYPVEEPCPGRQISWDPGAGIIDAEDLETSTPSCTWLGRAIVGRWTPEKKARILESRVKGTRLLCESLAHLRSRPMVLVSASAIGYYGDRGDRVTGRGKPRGLDVSFGGRAKPGKPPQSPRGAAAFEW